jgi:hypothetical protein
MSRSAGGFAFSWPDLPITVTLSRIRESSRGTTAELMAFYTINGSGKAKTLTHQTINLLTSKDRLAKELQGRQEAPWQSILEQVAGLSLRAIREGQPIESLEPSDDDSPAYFVLNPLIYAKNTTIMYGPGDSMKSALALYCGMLLASGVPGPNLLVAPTQTKVLFLDWEMTAQDVRSRAKLFRTGDSRLIRTPEYRRCIQPLADDLAAIRKVVDDGGYEVLILDSLAMAAGGHELEKAEAAIRFNAALRELNCASLVIGHTPKPNEEQKQRHLYGSVFFHNLCRVSWEVRREGDTMGLYQRKNNLGAKQSPMGLKLVIDDFAAFVEEADLFDDPELSSALPLQDQLANALQQTPGQTVNELALLINAKPSVIRVVLNRYKNRFMTMGGAWNLQA